MRCEPLIVITLLHFTASVLGQTNPCPSLFQYSSDSTENFGLFTLHGAQMGQTYVIDVKFTIRGRLPSSFYGQILLFDGKDATVQKILRNQPVMYKIRFPVQNPLPTITEIKVNGGVVCEGAGISGSVTKVSLQHTLQTSQTIIGSPNNNYPPEDYYHLPDYETKRPTTSQPITTNSFQQSLPIFWQFLNNNISSNPSVTQKTTTTQATTTERRTTTTTTLPPTTTTRPPTTTTTTTTSKPFVNDSSSQVLEVCGKVSQSYRPLILGGAPIERGSWPWLVAIYINDPKSLSFHCAGNLISSRAVLTAAHCMKMRGIEYKAEHLLIVAGRHNLLDWNEATSRTSSIERVIVHPDFDPSLSNFDGDLAIMIVKNSITFTDYIKPICLWEGNSELKQIEGEDGIVVGWGKDQNGKDVSPEPKKVTAKIVSNEDCLRSNGEFAKLTSNRTMCAGDKDGQGPCSGDSGGGLVLQRNDRWVIRGLVAGAFNDIKKNSCDLMEFVIYSDVAKFMNWVHTEMEW